MIGVAKDHAAVRQYALAEILAVWAAAAVPMGVLAWVVAPWLSNQPGGDEPLGQALLMLVTAIAASTSVGIDPPPVEEERIPTPH